MLTTPMIDPNRPVPPLLVLAGGFGTRLQSVVADVPKPMAPVNNRPFIAYLIERWVAQGVRQFVFLLHYHASLIRDFLAVEEKQGVLRGCAVNTIVEAAPLGTGGAVSNAIDALRIEGDFLVANADTWLDDAIRNITCVDSPAISVVRVPDAKRYGMVYTDGDHVSRFEEKSSNAGEGWINAGLYHLDHKVVADWSGGSYSLEQQLLPALAISRRLRVARLEQEFIDIGVPDDYARFCRWIESDRKKHL